MKGVPHYLPSGKLYTGKTHKMKDGTLHSGATHTKSSKKLTHKKPKKTHTASSKRLYHFKELSAKAKKTAKA